MAGLSEILVIVEASVEPLVMARLFEKENDMPKVVCKSCLGTGIELGVYGRRICCFCSGVIIAEVMAMSDDKVSAELVASGVDPDAEVARLREMANELHVKHSAFS